MTVAGNSQSRRDRTGGRRRLAAAGLVAVLVGLGTTGVAGAAVFAVPCGGADGGAAGLVKAVNDANGAPGADAIELAAGCTYTLTAPVPGGNGLPVITGELAIRGHGAVIRRSAPAPFRILEVASGAAVTMDQVTVTGGSVVSTGATAYAGGIFNRGVLTLTGSVISNNTAVGDGTSAAGAGITNDGVLTLAHSVLRGNAATSSGSTVFVAVGGGVINRPAGTMTISDSLVEGNSVLASGSSPNFFIASGGGIGSQGALTVVRTTVRANRAIASGAHGRGNGAGVSLAGGTLDMRDSNIQGNGAAATGTRAASNGGGMENYGEAHLANTTVTGNRAVGPEGLGGGIFNGFELTMTDSLVARNLAAATATPPRGGGIYRAGPVVLQNTPVVGNVPDNCNPPIAGC